MREVDQEGYHNFTEKSPGVGAGCGPNLGEAEDGGEQDEVDEFLNRPHVKAVLGVGAAATLCGEID